METSKTFSESENQNWKQFSIDQSKFLAPNKFKRMENATFAFRSSQSCYLMKIKVEQKIM
jgi:hypothetical protein